MKPKLKSGRTLAIASTVLLFVASFLPWSKISILGVSKSVLGIQGDGKIQIGIAIIVLALLAFPKIKAWISMIFAAIAGLIAVVDFNSITAMNKKIDGMFEFAFGFYLIPIAILGLFAGCIWSMLEGRQTKPQRSNLVPNIQSEAVG